MMVSLYRKNDKVTIFGLDKKKGKSKLLFPFADRRQTP